MAIVRAVLQLSSALILVAEATAAVVEAFGRVLTAVMSAVKMMQKSSLLSVRYVYYTDIILPSLLLLIILLLVVTTATLVTIA
jgi:hypothetical protein